MKHKPAIPAIQARLFWNVDMTTIDYDKNARHVIERVLMRGSLKDWFVVKSYYGVERLKQEVVNMRSLDKITLHFCSWYFQIPKTQFKCYNIPPSYQQLWNY